MTWWGSWVLVRQSLFRCLVFGLLCSGLVGACVLRKLPLFGGRDFRRLRRCLLPVWSAVFDVFFAEFYLEMSGWVFCSLVWSLWGLWLLKRWSVLRCMRDFRYCHPWLSWVQLEVLFRGVCHKLARVWWVCNYWGRECRLCVCIRIRWCLFWKNFRNFAQIFRKVASHIDKCGDSQFAGKHQTVRKLGPKYCGSRPKNETCFDTFCFLGSPTVNPP